MPDATHAAATVTAISFFDHEILPFCCSNVAKQPRFRNFGFQKEAECNRRVITRQQIELGGIHISVGGWRLLLGGLSRVAMKSVLRLRRSRDWRCSETVHLSG